MSGRRREADSQPPLTVGSLITRKPTWGPFTELLLVRKIGTRVWCAPRLAPTRRMSISQTAVEAARLVAGVAVAADRVLVPGELIVQTSLLDTDTQEIVLWCLCHSTAPLSDDSPPMTGLERAWVILDLHPVEELLGPFATRS